MAAGDLASASRQRTAATRSMAAFTFLSGIFFLTLDADAYMTDHRTTDASATKQADVAPCPSGRMGGADWALLALLAVGLGVICVTVGDYGISWDEKVQKEYGEAVLRYFLSAGQDKSCNGLGNLRFYGPTFELVTAAISRLWSEHAYLVRHAVTAITALLTLPALVRIGRQLNSPWVGLQAEKVTSHIMQAEKVTRQKR